MLLESSKGEPAHFRTTDAFAKQGRERYAVWLARPRFETCLSEALLPERPVHFRAALAYLDVCFSIRFPMAMHAWPGWCWTRCFGGRVRRLPV